MLLRIVSVSAIVLSTITIPAAAASAEVVDAMSRDFGITAEQALMRIRDEKVALKIAPAAQEAAAESFGGSWYADGKLRVAVTDPAKADAVRATGAEPVLRTKSFASLNAVKNSIDRLSKAGSVSKDVAGWRVDVQRGAVVVDALPGADVSGLPKDVVVNTEGVQRPQPFAAGTVGGDPFYTGNVRCSIGFSVHGGYVTAGHCNVGAWNVYGWDRSWQGEFVGSSFPTNDYGWVRTGGGWWNVPVVLGWGQVSDALVRGSWEAPPGTSVCRSGSTTHWHCGVVQGRNETVNYQQGAVYEMVGTSVCAEPGDSGGSFITGDQAQGVTSGGYGNCSSGGRTWFQPVNEILRVYGLTLLTA
jgi:streptogrisin C